jgi:tRNA (cmo5U34)-methyltransferase
MDKHPYDAMFSGIIGREYDILKLICPVAAEMSHLVGATVGQYAAARSGALQVLELGGGTGITTLAILNAAETAQVLSVDSEPVMQGQARQSLARWIDAGRLQFQLDDALSALRGLDSASVDIMASAYTLHNFETGYRDQVLQEIFRVLRSGGLFVNGDRYALDDIDAHTRMTQQEVAGYFKVLVEMNRLDLLEHWIIHLFSDESHNHVMREQAALGKMQDIGFKAVALSARQQVNALLTAYKTD